MARRIVHQLVDDVDGTVLEVGEGETVLFSLDGVAYEIDVSDENGICTRRQSVTDRLPTGASLPAHDSVGSVQRPL